MKFVNKEKVTKENYNIKIAEIKKRIKAAIERNYAEMAQDRWGS